MYKNKFFILLLLSGFVHQSHAQKRSISSNGIMKDIDGNNINAHGGGILFFNEVYYWYGEIKKGITKKVPNSNWENYRVDVEGVSCYSSNDLIHWKNEGVVLSANKTDSLNDLHTSKVVERPKVIYNQKTKKFVMWMHIDTKDYQYAQTGVAISDSPTGPFTYIRSVRPNGNMARDMTIFVDDDQKAYQFYSSEENKTMHICLLSDDYLTNTTTEIKILADESREAPAVFKYHNKYYLITSGCTGWSPNPASYSVTDNILGNWVSHKNPCTGKDADKTFFAQSAFILPVAGNSDKYIFMADKWNKLDLAKSNYVWLPLEMTGDGQPEIKWKRKWKIK